MKALSSSLSRAMEPVCDAATFRDSSKPKGPNRSMRLLLPHHASSTARKYRAGHWRSKNLRSCRMRVPAASLPHAGLRGYVCGPLKEPRRARSTSPTLCESIAQQLIWLTLTSLPARWKQPISNSFCRPGRRAVTRFMILPKMFRSFPPRARTITPCHGSNSTSKRGAWMPARRGGTVHVHYRVFANDLTGSFSQVDIVHANLNGPSVFMYVDGHKPDPITLNIEAPARMESHQWVFDFHNGANLSRAQLRSSGGYAAGNLRRLHRRPV